MPSQLGRNDEALALAQHVDPLAKQTSTTDSGRAAMLKALQTQLLLRLGRRMEGLP